MPYYAPGLGLQPVPYSNMIKKAPKKESTKGVKILTRQDSQEFHKVWAENIKLVEEIAQSPLVQNKKSKVGRTMGEATSTIKEARSAWEKKNAEALTLIKRASEQLNSILKKLTIIAEKPSAKQEAKRNAPLSSDK